MDGSEHSSAPSRSTLLVGSLTLAIAFTPAVKLGGSASGSSDSDTEKISLAHFRGSALTHCTCIRKNIGGVKRKERRGERGGREEGEEGESGGRER